MFKNKYKIVADQSNYQIEIRLRLAIYLSEQLIKNLYLFMEDTEEKIKKGIQAIVYHN